MELKLQKLGKRFTRHWIFRNLSDHIQSGEKVAIIGGNGSGKSTLLQILCGAQPCSEGNIEYNYKGKQISEEQIFAYLSFAAPYTQIIEELSLEEMFQFHSGFKQMNCSFEEFRHILNYPFKTDQLIRFYSSGMKQRVKLALAILSKDPFLLLDEPTSNLDQDGKDWYLDLIEKYSAEKTLIIASNEPLEYAMTNRQIAISQVDLSID